MKYLGSVAILVSASVCLCTAQTPATTAPQPNLVAHSSADPAPVLTRRSADAAKPAAPPIVVPADTKISLVLNHGLSGKTAHQGETVYFSTAAPVTVNNRIVVPVGSYVQGIVDSTRRPGMLKGKGEILLHFTQLIFPSGYTVKLTGDVNDAPDLTNAHTIGSEGAIQHDSEKGRRAASSVQSGGEGALIGAIAAGGKGALIGGGAGALLGVLMTRGHDLYLPRGTSIEMVLNRPLTLDSGELGFAGYTPPPPPGFTGPAGNPPNQTGDGRSPLPLPFPCC
jgi:hypothetical protein